MNYYDRLSRAIAESNWNDLIDVLKPKYFPRDEKGNLIDKKILAKVAETLTIPSAVVPTNVRIVLLKCLVNSCVDGYKHKEDNSENEFLHYRHELYSSLSNVADGSDDSLFPYNGMAALAVDRLRDYVLYASVQMRRDDSTEYSKDDYEMLRLSVLFLCNLVTFACDSDKLPRCLDSLDFKSNITGLCACDQVQLARGACAYVHNALKRLPDNYFSMEDIIHLVQPLINADKKEIQSARDTLIVLVKRANWLRNAYDCLHDPADKIYLLEIMLMAVRDSVYAGDDSDMSTNFPTEVIQFISERFKKRSDLILKTVDSYLDGIEPTEITLLLDIICVMSSKDTIDCHLLQSDKSLFINCIFLLKSLHMAGKASENHFTPVQKLSEIVPSTLQADSATDEKNIQEHPAFGFKAGLIRAIGNLSHKHKGNQELLRETDAIPLLLDCCNIDARNPLIMQWTIFALRNLCENCPENQDIIRNCNKVGVVDSAVLHEMGLKLHEGEDGKAIGILPLPQK